MLFLNILPSAITNPITISSGTQGWLLEAEKARIVHFDVDCYDPFEHGTFYGGPHTSGFIFLKGDEFSISLAEPWGVAQIEYHRGVLHEERIHSIAVNQDANPVQDRQLNFDDALSKSISETGFETLGNVVEDVLRNPGSWRGKYRFHRDYGDGASDEVVMGNGPGALLSYTSTTPVRGSSKGLTRRMVCKFTVILNEK